ncbi:MAG: trypsin-like peptidase domain-containing protein [Spirochaetales bacterium]|nr:trypsin-like peptidase domain-containing protein [Spirochaetales bacterium]
MRLYSRHQVLLLGSATLAAGLALGAGAALALKGLRESAPAASSAGEAELAAPAPVSGEAGYPASYIEAQALAGDFTVEEKQNISVYEKYNEGVVNVTTEVLSLNFFLEPVPRESGTGSGSIIDARGYVLTNYHVVKDSYKVWVNLASGERLQAEVVGVDSENDLAVIKFDPPSGTRLTVIPYGTSTGLKVGQKLLAIGNPFGLDRTLTEGIVSALGRPVQNGEGVIIQGMIQTDASINQGNSGGPLLNSRGEMIGINTMIYSTSGGSVGIGFAVPVDTAKRVVPDLIKYGMVRRGAVEATFVQLFPELVAYMQEKGMASGAERGLLVSQLEKGGNADRSGLRAGSSAVRYGRSVFYVGGDIIVAVDGLKVESIADLYAALEDNKPGDEVEVSFVRGGRTMTARVALSERDE